MSNKSVLTFKIKQIVEGKESVSEAAVELQELAKAAEIAGDVAGKSGKKFKESVTEMAAIGMVAGQANQALSELTNVIGDLTAAYAVQLEQETKLETVMRQRMNATEVEISAIKRLATEQQKLGVIGDEVQLAGAQQMATFLDNAESVATLLPAMNNLLAQQKGLSATTQDAVTIGNLFGKVMQGQTTALKKVGITFTESEAEALQYANEIDRASILCEIITNNVGQMNQALAATDAGKQKQLANAFSDIKENMGRILSPLKPIVSGLASVGSMGTGILRLAQGVKIVTTAMKGLTLATKAFMSVGIIAAISAILWLIDALTNSTDDAADSMDNAKSAAENLADAEKAEADAVSKAQGEIDIEIRKLKELIDAKADTTKAVAELNSKYGEQFGHHKTASEWYKVLIANSRTYCRQLGFEAKARELSVSAASSYMAAENAKAKVYAGTEWFRRRDGQRMTEQDHRQFLKELSWGKIGVGAFAGYGANTGTTENFVFKTPDGQGANEIIGYAKEWLTNWNSWRSLTNEMDAALAQSTKLSNQIKTNVDNIGKIDEKKAKGSGNSANSAASKAKAAAEKAERERKKAEEKQKKEEEKAEKEREKRVKEFAEKTTKSINKVSSNAISPFIGASTMVTDRQAEIDRLQKMKEVAPDLFKNISADSLTQQINEIEAELKGLDGVNFKFHTEELEAQKKALQGLRTEAIKASTEMSRLEKMKKIAPNLYKATIKGMSFESVTQQIRELEAQMAGLDGDVLPADKAVLQEQIDYFKQLRKEVVDYEGAVTSAWSSVKGLVSNFESLNDVLEGHAHGWEAVVKTVDSFISTFQLVSGVISIINMLTEANDAGTASTIASTAAEGANAAAKAIEAPVVVAANESMADSNLKLAASLIALKWASVPFGAAAAAGEIGAMTAAVQAIPALANGGVVYGDTLARVGEYAGASRNPEVIAPLDKLKSLIGGGNVHVSGEFKLKGRTLLAAIEKEQLINSRR